MLDETIFDDQQGEKKTEPATGEPPRAASPRAHRKRRLAPVQHQTNTLPARKLGFGANMSETQQSINATEPLS